MTFRRSRVFIISSFAMAAAVAAMAGDIGGPSLGFVADGPGHSVRPIRGIPGAATWGNAVDWGVDVFSIALAPRRDFALVSGAAGVRAAALAPDGTPVIVDAGLPPGFRPSAIAFSPSGATVALYDGGGRALWLLRGGSAGPIDVSMLPGAAVKLAVSDGAEPLLAVVPDDDPQSVFVLDAKGNYRLISSFGAVTAIAFLGQSGDLAIADRGPKQLLLVRDPLSGNAPVALLDAVRVRPHPGPLIAGPSSPAFLDGPLDIASSADGRLLAVLARRSASLFDLAGGEWTQFGCACAGAALVPLHGNAVFRIGDSTTRPLWILDGDAVEPRMVFVPAGKFEAQP